MKHCLPQPKFKKKNIPAIRRNGPCRYNRPRPAELRIMWLKDDGRGDRLFSCEFRQAGMGNRLSLFAFARPSQRLRSHKGHGVTHYFTWPWLQTKVGSAKLYIQSLRTKPQRSFTCNMPPFLIAEELCRKICQAVIPTC